VARSYSRNFYPKFDEILHRRLETETKEPLLWVQNPISGCPTFTPILPEIGSPHDAFLMGALKHFSNLIRRPATTESKEGKNLLSP